MAGRRYLLFRLSMFFAAIRLSEISSSLQFRMLN